MSHLFPGLAEAFADHLTIWAVAFAAAVVLIERVAAPRKRGIKLLVGLAMAHTLAVIIVGGGVGVGVIDIVTEVSLLARLLAGWVFVLGVGTVLFEVALPRLGVTLSRIIEDLTVFGAVAIISLLVLRRGGVDVTGIVATSAVVTAVIGLRDRKSVV